MSLLEISAIIVLLFIFSSALYTDIKHRKIKNQFTLPLSLLGLIISVFIFPVLHVLIYTTTLFVIGILGWRIGLWKAGDSKLTLSTGIWTMIALGQPLLLFALLYSLLFIIFHLLIGHFIGLKKYKFSFIQYARALRTNVNERFGTFVGTFTILLSFVSSLILVNII